MYCKEIEWKDKEKKPVMGIVLKQDENYVYFKTRKGEYQFAHNSIEAIKPTKIVFEESDGDIHE